MHRFCPCNWVACTIEKGNVNMRNLWVRAGMTLAITEEEEEILLSGEQQAGEEILRKVFSEGRARLDGETYCPDSAVMAYNEEYGTSYEGEPEWMV